MKPEQNAGGVQDARQINDKAILTSAFAPESGGDACSASDSAAASVSAAASSYAPKVDATGADTANADAATAGNAVELPPAVELPHADELPPADVKITAGSLTSLNNDKLFALYRDTREISVRNEIVGRHMYLIDIITRKFINRGVEYEDLCQIASIALIKAVERFDLTKGVKFVSFATPTIVGEIKRYFRDKGSTIRIPRRIYEIYQKVNQAKEYLSQSLSRTPMVSDIAEYLKISEENVLEIIESWNVYNIQSFEQNAFSEDNLELHETIGEDDFEFEKIENRDFIEKSMAKLSESEREFINLRYMNDMTQKQIAAVMNVSQMYISRLEKKIIRKFRMILDK